MSRKPTPQPSTTILNPNPLSPNTKVDEALLLTSHLSAVLANAEIAGFGDMIWICGGVLKLRSPAAVKFRVYYVGLMYAEDEGGVK